jgi:hypothetical protein
MPSSKRVRASNPTTSRVSTATIGWKTGVERPLFEDRLEACPLGARLQATGDRGRGDDAEHECVVDRGRQEPRAPIPRGAVRMDFAADGEEPDELISREDRG